MYTVVVILICFDYKRVKQTYPESFVNIGCFTYVLITCFGTKKLGQNNLTPTKKNYTIIMSGMKSGCHAVYLSAPNALVSIPVLGPLLISVFKTR